MNDEQLVPMERSDECLGVLAAYRAEHAVVRQIDPENAGWINRLKSVAGVEETDLSTIHGRLIAHGLLKFQLTGRTTGVQYQLSSAGQRLLESATANA